MQCNDRFSGNKRFIQIQTYTDAVRPMVLCNTTTTNNNNGYLQRLTGAGLRAYTFFECTYFQDSRHTTRTHARTHARHTKKTPKKQQLIMLCTHRFTGGICSDSSVAGAVHVDSDADRPTGSFFLCDRCGGIPTEQLLHHRFCRH